MGFLNITYSNNIDYKSKRVKFRSSKKLFLGRPEIKHTNEKTTIVLYIYNKKHSLTAIRLKQFINKLKKYNYFIYKIRNIYKLYLNINLYLNKTNKSINFVKIFIKKKYGWMISSVNYDQYKNHIKNDLSNLYLKFNKHFTFNFVSFFLLYYKNTQLFKYLKNILYINRILFLETKKANNVFLNFENLGITSLLKSIYNNKIEIDIVNHKAIHFNSSILSKAIAFKIKNRKISAIRILNKILLTKLPPRYILLKNNTKEDLKQNVLSNLRYKVVNGIRFKVSGRLTRRLTAMRSISKLRYKGSIKNINSSFKNLSSSMIRNNITTNLQLTKINGKTRNGAFGLKCWVSTN